MRPADEPIGSPPGLLEGLRAKLEEFGGTDWVAAEEVVSLEELRGELIAELLAERTTEGRLLSPEELASEYESVLDVRLVNERGELRVIESADRRRRGGAFYTPMPLVADVVRRTLAPRLEAVRGLPSAVLNLRILDPSVGCGQFLVAALEALAFATGRPEDVELRRRIAARCLFGVDTDAAAVATARLAIQRAAGGSEPIPVLEDNVRWGDTLCGVSLVLHPHPENATREELDDIARSTIGDERGDALAPYVHWDFDFPDVFARAQSAERWFRGSSFDSAGFDFVLGNPPYLQEARGNAETFRRLRRSPIVAMHCERMTDTFHLFLCLGLNLLKAGGRLGMVVPDYWLTRTGASRVREALLARRVDSVVLFGDTPMFPEAPGHHTSILVVDNEPPASRAPLADARILKLVPGVDPLLQLQLDDFGELRLHPAQGRFLVLDRPEQELLLQIEGKHPDSGERPAWQSARFRLPRGSISNGLQSYPDRVRGEGVFVLEPEELEALGLSEVERELVRPFLRTRDIRRFVPAEPSGLFVLYVDRDARRRVEANEEGAYDRVRAHLERFRDDMTSVSAPYGLHRSRSEKFFVAPTRLVLPRKCGRPTFAPVEEPLYADESASFLIVPPEVDRDALLGVLCSTLAHWFFYTLKRQGTRLQLDNEVLLRFPLPVALRHPERAELPDHAVDTLTRLVQAVQTARSADAAELPAIESRIDEAVEALYGLDASSSDRLRRLSRELSSAPA